MGVRMDLDTKYELIEPLPGEGTGSFCAKQITTGRDVTVHILVGGPTAENDALLARVRALSSQSVSGIVEVVGDNKGTPYVVTAAPPFQHLPEWLADHERTARTEAPRHTHTGASGALAVLPGMPS